MAAGTWDSEAIRSLGQKVQHGSDEMQAGADRMTSDLAATDGQWQGAARQQFEAKFLDWKNASKQLQDALDGLSSFLTSAAQTYEEAEERLRSSIG